MNVERKPGHGRFGFSLFFTARKQAQRMNDTELAKLWGEIAQAHPYQALGRLSHLIEDAQAQPGYVGPNYRAGGVVLVGPNPAVEKNAEANRWFYDSLGALSGSPDDYKAFNQSLHEGMASAPWHLYTDLIKPIVEALGIYRADIAYINLCPWRHDKPQSFYRPCWDTYTHRQISLLEPKLLIALGADAKDGVGLHLKNLYDGRAVVKSVRRPESTARNKAAFLEDVAAIAREHNRAGTRTEDVAAAPVLAAA